MKNKHDQIFLSKKVRQVLRQLNANLENRQKQDWWGKACQFYGYEKVNFLKDTTTWEKQFWISARGTTAVKTLHFIFMNFYVKQ